MIFHSHSFRGEASKGLRWSRHGGQRLEDSVERDLGSPLEERRRGGSGEAETFSRKMDKPGALIGRCQ